MADDTTRSVESSLLKLIDRRVSQLKKWRYCVGAIPYPQAHLVLLDRYPEARVFAIQQGCELPDWLKPKVRTQRTEVVTSSGACPHPTFRLYFLLPLLDTLLRSQVTRWLPAALSLSPAPDSSSDAAAIAAGKAGGWTRPGAGHYNARLLASRSFLIVHLRTSHPSPCRHHSPRLTSYWAAGGSIHVRGAAHTRRRVSPSCFPCLL